MEKPFRDEEEALQYAIHNQRHRRNMTEADLLRCIEAVDKRQEQGEGQERVRWRFQPKASNDATGKSVKQTAEIVGTSQAKVECARKVSSDPKEREEVMSGKKTIHRASEDAKRRQAQKPQRDEKGRFAAQDGRRQVLLSRDFQVTVSCQPKLGQGPPFSFQ